jgi:hypothetical protein
MKIKHILLSLVCATSVVSAAHTQQHPQQQQRAPNAVAVTGEDLIGMFQHFDRTYFQLIEELRRGLRVTRDDILSAYENDGYLERVHDGGHASFKHKILPMSVGVIPRGSNQGMSATERTQHHRSLQVYVNVIKIFLQPFINIGKAVEEMNQMALKEWQQKYSKNLEAATEAFNACTTAEWATLLAKEDVAFEEYFREEEENLKKKKKK